MVHCRFRLPDFQVLHCVPALSAAFVLRLALHFLDLYLVHCRFRFLDFPVLHCIQALSAAFVLRFPDLYLVHCRFRLPDFQVLHCVPALSAAFVLRLALRFPDLYLVHFRFRLLDLPGLHCVQALSAAFVLQHMCFPYSAYCCFQIPYLLKVFHFQEFLPFHDCYSLLYLVPASAPVLYYLFPHLAPA